MITTFQSPVAGITGKLQYNGKFYIRRLYGKYVLQRCPNRKGHVPTTREKANQQRFILQYRKTKPHNSKFKIQNSIVHDTIIHTDSIVEVIEYPPRAYIPPFYKRCTAIFWTLMALLLLYAIIRIRYSIK